MAKNTLIGFQAGTGRDRPIYINPAKVAYVAEADKSYDAPPGEAAMAKIVFDNGHHVVVSFTVPEAVEALVAEMEKD